MKEVLDSTPPKRKIKNAHESTLARAIKRGVDFSLTLRQFHNMYKKQKCFYCGVKTTDVNTFNKDYGFDRYNTILSCEKCELQKGTMKPSEYFKKIRKEYKSPGYDWKD